MHTRFRMMSPIYDKYCYYMHWVHREPHESKNSLLEAFKAKQKGDIIDSCIQHKVQVGMCIQRRFKSVCPYIQSGQSLSFPPDEALNPWLPIERPLKTLISLRICAGCSESSLSAHANSYLLLDIGSYGPCRDKTCL